MASLKKMTPADIDAEIFPLWVEYARQTDYIFSTLKRIKDNPSLYQGRRREDADKDLERYRNKRDEISAQLNPYDQEYERRGGWARFIVVGGGHLHRWRHCHSVRPTTRAYLLSEASGLTDAEVVKRYSYTACTHCFPDAPVANKPPLDTSIFCEGSGTRTKSMT